MPPEASESSLRGLHIPSFRKANLSLLWPPGHQDGLFMNLDLNQSFMKSDLHLLRQKCPHTPQCRVCLGQSWGKAKLSAHTASESQSPHCSSPPTPWLQTSSQPVLSRVTYLLSCFFLPTSHVSYLAEPRLWASSQAEKTSSEKSILIAVGLPRGAGC